MTKTIKNRQSKSRKQRQHDKNRQSRQRRMKGGSWIWDYFFSKKTPENPSLTQNPITTVNQNPNQNQNQNQNQNPNQNSLQQGGKRRRRSTRCKK